MKRNSKLQKCLIILATFLNADQLIAAQKEVSPPDKFYFTPVVIEKVGMKKEILNRLTPVLISWEKNKDSNAFEVQIAVDESFSIFNSIFVSRPSAHLKFRRLGTQFIRVRAIKSKTETAFTGRFSRIFSITIIREKESIQKLQDDEADHSTLALVPFKLKTPSISIPAMVQSTELVSSPMIHRWMFGIAIGQGLSHEKVKGISTNADGLFIIPGLSADWIGTKGKMEYSVIALGKRVFGVQDVSLPIQWSGGFSVLRKSVTPLFTSSQVSLGLNLEFDSWSEPSTSDLSASTSIIYILRKMKTGTVGPVACLEKNEGYDESSFCLKIGNIVWSSVENGGNLISMPKIGGWKGSLIYKQPLFSSSKISWNAGVDAFKLSNQSDNQIIIVNALFGINKEF